MKPATEMTPEERSAMRDQINAIRRQYPDPLATVVDVVDHIDHLVSVAGIDHIGIGCDFDGGGGIDGVFDVSEVANITIELVRRGYSEEDIRKIWGGNLLRVFRDVQAVAAIGRREPASMPRPLMKTLRSAWVAALLLVPALSSAHPLRLSLCQIEYSSQAATLTVS